MNTERNGLWKLWERERLWRLSGDFPGPQSAAAVTALLPRRVRFIDEYRSGTGPQGLGPAISQPGHTARVANEAKHTINHWVDCWVLQLEAGKHHWQKGGGLGVWCGETQVVLPMETRVGHNRSQAQNRSDKLKSLALDPGSRQVCF